MITIYALHIPAEPIPYQRLIFSGGEVQIRINSQRAFSSATIETHIRSSEDLIELLMVTDALRRHGCKELSLIMPYIPYARQDRVCAPGEALSIKVFADLINAQHYEEVEVWDPHSDVATALLHNCYAVHCLDFVARIPLDMADITLVAPDAGAAKKVMTVSQKLGAHFLQATKIRDANTGEITGTSINHGVLHSKNHYLIVDDICDGGRTFIELAKEIKLSSAKVDLYVTHGIFSKGFAVFDGLIDTIYCANPWPPLFEAHNRIKV